MALPGKSRAVGARQTLGRYVPPRRESDHGLCRAAWYRFSAKPLEPRRRIYKEMCADHDRVHHRHFNPDVDDVVKAFGCDSGISESTVS